jgi:hypothetical protein
LTPHDAGDPEACGVRIGFALPEVPMTRLSRRSILALGLGMPLAACATRPSSPPAEGTLPVTLTDAFVGRSRGRGVFVAPVAGIERRFSADLYGTLRGDTLTVVEDFRYDDGEENRLTWVFRRTGPGTWEGQREDTVGVARGTENGREIRLEYTADFRSGGEVTRLGFRDVIWRRADGVIVNDAVVSRYGIPVGKVRFEIRR